MKKERPIKTEQAKPSAGNRVKQILLVLWKILRWPLLDFGGLFAGFYGFYGAVNAFHGGTLDPVAVVGQYGMLLVLFLLLVVWLVSLLTSSLFTDTFMASTGIAALLYLLASLLIRAPYTWGDEGYLDFDLMKMMVVLLLVGAVFLGDIAVFAFRKMLKKRSVRHMMQHH